MLRNFALAVGAIVVMVVGAAGISPAASTPLPAVDAVIEQRPVESTLEPAVSTPAPQTSVQAQVEAAVKATTPVPQQTTLPTPKPTAPAPQNCNPNYSGCLRPDASDYDCAGGSGNGPYYTGLVQVLGYDEYKLDRDGDGWACE